MKALLSKQKIVNKVILLPIEQVTPNPYQPRKVFEEEKLEQLAASIAQYGLLQPITVTQLLDGNYQLVAGERRLMACKKLKLDTIAAIIVDMDEESSSAMALVENIQRCDLNFFEEAVAIDKLMKITGQTQQVIAGRLGKNQSTIANKLRLLQLSPNVRQAILSANLTERHARALLPLIEKGDDALINAVKLVQEKQFNVAQTEQYVRSFFEEKKKKDASHKLFIVKDSRIFVNSIDKAVKTMQLSGIEAKTDMEEEEDCLVYTVRIPKKSELQNRHQAPTA